jgi:hypothetical protein
MERRGRANQVVYFSRGGNTRKIAEAISAELGVVAMCQFAGSWGQLKLFFAGSWGHPFAA